MTQAATGGRQIHHPWKQSTLLFLPCSARDAPVCPSPLMRGASVVQTPASPDSPARRSPAAPWRRRRGRPGRPRGEPTRGPSSPGSRRNPATRGGGRERETLPEPRGSPRGRRGSWGGRTTAGESRVSGCVNGLD